jgi:hypothetical protein
MNAGAQGEAQGPPSLLDYLISTVRYHAAFCAVILGAARVLAVAAMGGASFVLPLCYPLFFIGWPFIGGCAAPAELARWPHAVPCAYAAGLALSLMAAVASWGFPGVREGTSFRIRLFAALCSVVPPVLAQWAFVALQLAVGWEVARIEL